MFTTIAGGAVAGLIAGLVVAVLLGLARQTLRALERCREEKYIRGLFIEGKVILDTEKLQFQGRQVGISAEHLRAFRYKALLKEVGVALERWTPHLSISQRKEIYDALDWFHTDPDRMHAVSKDGKVFRLVEVPDGTFPLPNMHEDAAVQVYERLRLVKWLKLK